MYASDYSLLRGGNQSSSRGGFKSPALKSYAGIVQAPAPTPCTHAMHPRHAPTPCTHAMHPRHAAISLTPPRCHLCATQCAALR
eukprot:363917-Chlamydomonas_euryale.AAC.10